MEIKEEGEGKKVLETIPKTKKLQSLFVNLEKVVDHKAYFILSLFVTCMKILIIFFNNGKGKQLLKKKQT